MLNTAHDGVQMRLTIGKSVHCQSKYGQIVPSTANPKNRHAAPAAIRSRHLSRKVRGLRSKLPAIKPKIIVAIDGTKFNVV